MKETVLQLIRKSLNYINEIERLQAFWKSNLDHIEEITAHYPQQYMRSKENYDNFISEIMRIDTKYVKEKLMKLQDELINANYADRYIEVLKKQLLDNQFESQSTSLQKLNDYNNLDLIKIIKNESIHTVKHQIPSHLLNLSLQNIPQSLQSLSQTLSSIEFFDLLKNKNDNLVLIGANGSGKSTFSRQIKRSIVQQLASFVAVIPAQKTFNVSNNTSIPLKIQAQTQLKQTHTHDKLYKNIGETQVMINEFGHIIDYLIAEHQEVTNITHQNYNKEDFEKKDSLLERVITIWKNIIVHINLQYDEGNIQAVAEDGNCYDFMALSDGEKSIFYCIASVLLVDKDGYIIIDEPENHLHMSIVNKLWDILEKVRSDCQFVYLTHNPSFAIGRANAKILWVKKYTPPSKWDYEEIPTDDTLPQQLMVELIGSKKKILFCEGERSSYDYKLYSILFQNYTVVPAGGHQKAIDYCKAFNENQKLSNLSAITIIDRDFYEYEEINAWKKNSIYTLDVMEVENILCDEGILTIVQKSVHASDDEYNEAIGQIFIHINSTKVKQAMEYTRFKTDKILSSLVGKATSAEALKQQLNNGISVLNPESFYNEHIQLLQEIFDKKDYDKALKHYNNKGMISFVGDKILKDYKNRVISFIKDNEDLQKKIINKYFKDIPND